MRRYGEQPYNFSRQFSYRELERLSHQGYEFYFYKSRLANKYYAVASMSRLPASGITHLEVVVEKKEPLYKQVLDMQLGRLPKSVNRTDVIPVIQIEPVDDNKRYIVYFVR